MDDEEALVEAGVLSASAPVLTIIYHRTHHPVSSRRRLSPSFPSSSVSQLFARPAPVPSAHQNGPSLIEDRPSGVSSLLSSLSSSAFSLFFSLFPAEEEVFLSPEVVFLRIYCLLTNLRVAFLPSRYPSTQALGNLPAAFYNDGVLNGRSLQLLLQEERDLDALVAPASPSRLRADSEALSAYIDAKLAQVLDFTLWCYEPCYSRFTSRVYRRSLSSVYAPFFLFRRRRSVAARFRAVDAVHILRTFLEVLERLAVDERTSKKDVSPSRGAGRFLLADAPTKADVNLYAYLSVLFQIPSEYTPWFGARALTASPRGEDAAEAGNPPGPRARGGAILPSETEDEGGNASTSSSSPVDATSWVSAPGSLGGAGIEEKERPTPLGSHASLTAPVASRLLRTLQQEQDILSRLAALLPVARSYLRMFDEFLAETAVAALDLSSISAVERRKEGLDSVTGDEARSSVSLFSLPPKKICVSLDESVKEGDGAKRSASESEEKEARSWTKTSALVAAVATLGLLAVCLKR
ncbi:conserved hypothetical protein [Neospora caninum Liverpool]|uniref:Mitochondrial outer membrane transport complex Sam37/metaxin N-terminal domain-containing protein n=1 Tax=Neospora caninum (strain Liverpool) TaxID=572307 RepID=F0VAW7_NEOCL|nr:conserved hypothetical protein [Neospora caninum Liverpool]CBZ50825.1 conserved hypothetical protein [Neospora caninum Liverpool]CEL68126.1 TPA: hypothetical protein BN1204_038990 [Neospora caninum Liverpool]|eukprot:XP_003880858.1 conserved hypothetical protein [Neospora caninum Liverpool]